MMKRKFFLFLLSLVFFTSCEKIILKKKRSLKIPFEALKIEKGTYDINLYHFEYPFEILEKESFLYNLDILSKKLLLKKKKISVMVNEEFFNDFERISKGDLLAEESVINKTASSLNEGDLVQLKRITKKNITKFKGTVQETLNLQIFFILRTLSKEEEFEEEKIYTELDKEEYIDELKEKRAKMIKIINKLKFDLIVYIEKPYEKQKNKFGTYWYEKEIVLNEQTSFSEKVVKYSKYPVYLGGINSIDIKKIRNQDLILRNKHIILENEEYYGYRYIKQDYIFFVSGKNPVYEFKNYKVNLKKVSVELEDLLKINDEYILSDFIGG